MYSCLWETFALTFLKKQFKDSLKSLNLVPRSSTIDLQEIYTIFVYMFSVSGGDMGLKNRNNHEILNESGESKFEIQLFVSWDI